MKVEVTVPKEFIDAGLEVGLTEEEIKGFIKETIEMSVLDPYYLDDYKEGLEDVVMMKEDDEARGEGEGE